MHESRSPSRAPRYMRCAGSIREESKYPTPPSGPAAIDGTHTHTLLEHCIKGRAWDALPMVGVRMKDHDGEFVIDAARAKRVNVALDYVRRRLDAYDNNDTPVSALMAERRVDPAFYMGRSDMAGTVDIQIHNLITRELEIIDLKDGMNPVPADGEQNILYAMGVLAGLRVTDPTNSPFWIIRLTIIQPKLIEKKLDPIVTHTMTAKELLDLVPQYKAAADATDDPNAPLTPGEKQCRYCAHKACAARTNAALAAAGVKFGPVEFIADPPPAPTTRFVTVGSFQQLKEKTMTELAVDAAHQLANQDAGSMSDEQLAQMIESEPLITQAIKAAKDEALRRLEMGKEVKGLKLVNGRGSRCWNLDDDAIAEKLKGMGVPKSAVYVTSLVSPAQAENLTWKNSKGEDKSLSERQLKTLKTEYISTLAGKLTVASESDPRPAVVRSAASLFGAVQEQPAAPATAELPAFLQMPAWMRPQ